MAEESGSAEFNDHVQQVANGMLLGQIVPFLGAGANLCDARGIDWIALHSKRLPSGAELSKHIVKQLLQGAPLTEEQIRIEDLIRVCQFADTTHGRGSLDEQLRPVFAGPFRTTSLHRFLARLPARWRSERHELHSSDEIRKHVLIVTTNYDDVMERAFEKRGEQFHVVTYLTNRGRHRFLHRSPNDGTSEIPLRSINQYPKLNDDDFPIILKIHGSAERNFVITEDDYIDHLSFGDIRPALPGPLRAQLNNSGFLFLGYALRDWNLRAFLRRLWREQEKKIFKSWAVMKDVSRFERTYWRNHEVNILDADLRDYVKRLKKLVS